SSRDSRNSRSSPTHYFCGRCGQLSPWKQAQVSMLLLMLTKRLKRFSLSIWYCYSATHVFPSTLVELMREIWHDFPSAGCSFSAMLCHCSLRFLVMTRIIQA